MTTPPPSSVFLKACQDNDLATVERYVQLGLVTRKQAGRALPMVAKIGHAAMVNMLLPNSAQVDRRAALEFAARNGHLDTVLALLPHNDTSAYTTALGFASSYGHLAIVHLLMPLSHVEDSRALEQAAAQGHTAVIQALLRHDHDPMHCTNALGQAVNWGHLDAVNLLIPLSRIPGSLALEMAALEGHTDIVIALLPHDDPKAYRSRALSKAAAHRHPNAIKVLLPVSDLEEAFEDCLAHDWWDAIEGLSPHLSPLQLKRATDHAPLDDLPQTRARWAAHDLARALSDAAPSHPASHAARRL